MAEDCLRCRGPLKADEERYGAYLSCIQCGYIGDSVAKAKVPFNPDEMGSAFRQQLVGVSGIRLPLLNLRRTPRVDKAKVSAATVD